MKINIYYFDNGVGMVSDSILIKNVLYEYDVVTYNVSKNNVYRSSDIGIFIQNVWMDCLDHNQKNIYIVNEELQNSLIDMFGVTKSELLSIFKPWMEGKFDVKVTEVAYTTYHCNTCGKYHPVKYHIEE